MRLSVLALLLLAGGFTSCVTTIDGAWVSGSVHDVTADDIRAAVAASRAAPKERLGGRLGPRPATQRPRQIDVVSQDEIDVYWIERKAVNSGHDIVKRVRGKWQYNGETLDLSEPIPYNPI